MIAVPPSEAGAVQVRSTVVFPGVPVTPVGAPGTVRGVTAEDAVDHMELVGHDFFLFIDAESDRPSVVYRRKGWAYGVIALDSETVAAAPAQGRRRASR